MKIYVQRMQACAYPCYESLFLLCVLALTNLQHNDHVLLWVSIGRTEFLLKEKTFPV